MPSNNPKHAKKHSDLQEAKGHLRGPATKLLWRIQDNDCMSEGHAGDRLPHSTFLTSLLLH